MFFFEKKNQKTFARCRGLIRSTRAENKSVLLLFFKKEDLAFPFLTRLRIENANPLSGRALNTMRVAYLCSLLLGLISAAAANAQGRDEACSDFSWGALTRCLPGQIELSEAALQKLYHQKIPLLQGKARTALEKDEVAWPAFRDRMCEKEGEDSGLNQHWASIAILQCELRITNDRIRLLLGGRTGGKAAGH